jgi:hypothetical protein
MIPASIFGNKMNPFRVKAVCKIKTAAFVCPLRITDTVLR